MPLYLILSIGIFFFSGTNSTGIHLNDLRRSIKTNNDSAFKVWLSDSLQTLKSNLIHKKENQLELKKIQFNVGEDSLSLEILQQYQLKITSKSLAKANDDIKLIIDLLKSYDELPNKEFLLRFIVVDDYYPSSAQNLIYDDLMEIRNLQAIESSPTIISSYTYIRGRLNDKKVIQELNNKEVTTQYNFIWKDQNLIKQKIN
jgi:hypothetical protein